MKELKWNFNDMNLVIDLVMPIMNNSENVLKS